MGTSPTGTGPGRAPTPQQRAVLEGNAIHAALERGDYAALVLPLLPARGMAWDGPTQIRFRRGPALTPHREVRFQVLKNREDDPAAPTWRWDWDAPTPCPCVGCAQGDDPLHPPPTPCPVRPTVWDRIGSEDW